MGKQDWQRCSVVGCRRKARWVVEFVGDRTGLRVKVPTCNEHGDAIHPESKAAA